MKIEETIIPESGHVIDVPTVDIQQMSRRSVEASGIGQSDGKLEVYDTFEC